VNWIDVGPGIVRTRAKTLAPAKRLMASTSRSTATEEPGTVKTVVVPVERTRLAKLVE